MRRATRPSSMHGSSIELSPERVPGRLGRQGPAHRVRARQCFTIVGGCHALSEACSPRRSGCFLALTTPASAWFAARGFGGFRAGGFDRFGAVGWHGVGAVGWHGAGVVGWHGVGCYGCWGMASRGALCLACRGGRGRARGLAAGAAIGAAAAAYPVGTDISVLPAGCALAPVAAVNYYRCGPTWFQPYYGGGGLYYRAVGAP